VSLCNNGRAFVQLSFLLLYGAGDASKALRLIGLTAIARTHWQHCGPDCRRCRITRLTLYGFEYRLFRHPASERLAAEKRRGQCAWRPANPFSRHNPYRTNPFAHRPPDRERQRHNRQKRSDPAGSARCARTENIEW